MKCLFKKIFILEGNIGAGKSTLLSYLGKAIPNVLVIPEPVSEWKNVDGDDLLKKFYNDPKKWGFAFEQYSMFTKAKKMREALASSADVIIMERSIFSDRAFQFVSFYLNKIDPLEMCLLDKYFDEFRTWYPALSGVIYLDTDPKLCLERIKTRGRREEKDIDEEYLKKLEEQFLLAKYDAPMLMVSGDYDEKDKEKTVQMVLKFITKCV